MKQFKLGSSKAWGFIFLLMMTTALFMSCSKETPPTTSDPSIMTEETTNYTFTDEPVTFELLAGQWEILEVKWNHNYEVAPGNILEFETESQHRLIFLSQPGKPAKCFHITESGITVGHDNDYAFYKITQYEDGNLLSLDAIEGQIVLGRICRPAN